MRVLRQRLYVLRRLLRVTLLAAALAVLVGLLALGRARANLGEVLVDAGSEMMRFEGATRQDVGRSMLINGARLRMSSGASEATLDEVLDFYEQACRSRAGDLDVLLRRTASAATTAPASSSVLGRIANSLGLGPILRTAHGAKGVVACLDVGSESMTLSDWMSRLSRFQETGNVSDVGLLRYVYVESTGSGTHLVAFWSEGELNVRRMFPGSGDVDGVDPAGVPRPKGSRRILSGWEDGHGESVAVYSNIAMPVRDSVTWYRENLLQGGYQRVPSRSEALEVFQRGDTMLSLVFEADGADRTRVTVLSTGRE